MIGNEHVTAEIAWLRRRGTAAAPPRHPLRTPECPRVGVLAQGRLTQREREHVARCRHCRALEREGSGSRFVPAAGAVAAALAVGLLLTGWRDSEPARFMAPSVRVEQPATRAVEADWPAPRLRVRSQALRLPGRIENPALPTIQPLERFRPPERVTKPMPIAALDAAGPPPLRPSPAPDVVALLGLRVL